MLQLVVLGHVVAEGVREVLDEGRASQLSHKALGVLNQLFLLDSFVNVEVVDRLLELLDELETLLPLELLVVGQVLQHNLSSQLPQGSLEDVRLVAEELLNDILVADRLEDVGREAHNNLQRLVKEVALDSQLQLGDVFSRNALIIELEQLLSDEQRVNHLELNWEDQLCVTVQLLQHLGGAVFQAVEQDLDLLEDVLFGL